MVPRLSALQDFLGPRPDAPEGMFFLLFFFFSVSFTGIQVSKLEHDP